MTCTSVEQRIALKYIDLLPPFVADDKASVSVDEQRHFYALMKRLYELASAEPLLFVPQLHEDDAYPNGMTKTNYDKPKLQEYMKKFGKAVDDLLQAMFNMGGGREVKLNKRQAEILSRLDVDVNDLPKAWTWMSTREDATLTAFVHCLFDRDYPYTSDIYARLLGGDVFTRFEAKLLGMGYARYDAYNIIASDCKLSLSVFNPKWADGMPKGGFEYGMKHTGIAAQYDECRAQPASFGLCIPGGMKPYLSAFDEMDDELKRFVFARTQRCWGCRYCVQTDKTGTRPLAAMAIECEGKREMLCPYFPGYSYSWTQIDDELARQLLEMLTFMDRFIPEKKKKR